MSDVRFPALVARSLAGEEFTLPGDLPARRTVVIAAFHQRHQADVDSWIAMLERAGVPGTPRDLPADAPTALLELPVLKRRWAPARGFIDGGMARGIGDPDITARTWTCYTDVGAFLAPFGTSDDSVVLVAVVSRAGDVLALVRDVPGAESFATVAAALDG